MNSKKISLAPNHSANSSFSCTEIARFAENHGVDIDYADQYLIELTGDSADLDRTLPEY